MKDSIILIIYPSLFGCYSKFERKVKRILSNMDNYSIVYFCDPQGFIEKCFNNDEAVKSVNKILEIELSKSSATHSIVFDDDESNLETLLQLEVLGVPIRKIPIAITKAVNIDKNESHDVYIGRGTAWGNPYAIGYDGDREEVIRKFKYDFDRDYLKGGEKFKENLKVFLGKRLGCHCKPAACHGDVLAEYLNSLDDGK